MAKAKTRRIQQLAVQVCQAVLDLTQNRRSRGQQFVMLANVQERLGLLDDDLAAAVAYAVESGALEEAHGSIAVHRQHL